MTKLTELSQRIGKILVIWGIASIIAGIGLLLVYSLTLLRGIGVQAIIWGVIDAVIAAYILFKQKQESVEKIAKTVSTNIYFDIIFQIVGLIVIIAYYPNLYMVGNGIGVVIQGFFLFILDRTYHNSLRKLEKVP
ncbi:MAG: DUF6992 family protein [Candidatus Thorarchaeota archaeon]